MPKLKPGTISVAVIGIWGANSNTSPTSDTRLNMKNCYRVPRQGG